MVCREAYQREVFGDTAPSMICWGVLCQATDGGRGGSRDSWGRLVAWAKADCAEPKCNDGQMKFCWSSDPYRHIVSKIGLVGYLKCQGPLMFAIKCAQFDKTWHPTPENIGLSSNFCTLYLHTFDILRNLYFLVIRIKCSWTSPSPSFS